MINQKIVDILVGRIKNNGINPATGEVMKLEDIKLQEYRDAVQSLL